MRGLAILTALLLVLPLAAADEGEGGEGSDSSSSPSSGPSPSGNGTAPDGNAMSGNGTAPPPEPEEDDGCPDDRPPSNLQERKACYCRDHPGDERCDREDDDEDGPGRPRPPAGWERWCRSEARSDSQRERCRQALDAFQQGREGRWVSFQVDAANRTLLDYRIDGRPALAAIHLETGSENLTVHRMGSTLRLGDADTELALHDDPTGLVRLKGGDGSVTVRLPADASVDRDTAGTVARVAYPDGRVGHLRSGNATWLDDRTVLASGFFAFLLPPAAGDDKPSRPEPEARQAQQQVQQAIERRKVGAEITVSAPASAARAAPGGGGVEVLAYDDVQVEVLLPGDVATPDTPIRIELDADLDEGRTIVLNLDRSVLESADPGALVLRYFDLHGQPDGSVVETEVVFRMASGLEDILDPSDDGGSPEYWVVEDANGLQAMFTVPHWSAHAITVGSLARLASQPSVAIGILAGAAGSVVAAAALLWPRRSEDE